MATKASKVLLMFLPAIMLTAWGVGVLRSDEVGEICFLAMQQKGCQACADAFCGACQEGQCPGGVSRVCLHQNVLIEVLAPAGRRATEPQKRACYIECACQVWDPLNPCGPSNPCGAFGICNAGGGFFWTQELTGSCGTGGGP